MADSETEKRAVGQRQAKPSKNKGRGKAAKSGEQTLSARDKEPLRKLVLDFLSTGESEVQLHDLTKEQRALVHSIALSMGLKTSSKGPETHRVLTIKRPPPSTKCARITTTDQVVQILETALPDVERILAAVGHRQEGQQELQSNRPSNYGLVGRKLVPPEPYNLTRSMMQIRSRLPISKHRGHILDVIHNNQVLIVEGATGSGKSTQVPQFFLEWGTKKHLPVRIVVSQPRRIGAVSVSERIAKERGEAEGSTVGYNIRMNSKCSSETVLSLTTSGCLLRVIAMDGAAFFKNTTHLIIDEVHERDLDTDFLLLATKLELKKNRRLRVVLMSATMDTAALSAYFNNAPVISVEGHSFGSKIYQMEDILMQTGYMTQNMEDYLGEITDEENANNLLAAYDHNRNELDIDNDMIVSLLELLVNSGEKGGVIVYLPGYHDMIQLMERLEICLPQKHIKIFLMHSGVDSIDMRKSFIIYPEKLKIILSTNIGQTSITIPDLLYVIDLGRVKMTAYDPATDASQLATTWISQADAQQRAGRVGRLRPGICYRLYSSDRLGRMNMYTVPEIMRRSLGEICLLAKMAAPEEPIVTYLSMAFNPPQPRAVLQACSRLKLLGVLQEADEKITALGRIIAELPLSVQLGKCVVYGLYFRCLGSMTIIASYHMMKTPFVLSSERNKKSNQQNSRIQFAGNSMSDSLAMLKLYHDFNQLPRKNMNAFCEKHSLCRSDMELFLMSVKTLRYSMRRIFEMTDHWSCSFDKDKNMIRLALTAGLYPKLAFVERKKRYMLVDETDSCLQISRNSCLSKQKLRSLPTDWLLYVDKNRTSDQRTVLEDPTLVSSLMVGLAAGKNARLEEHDTVDSDLCLDTWIRIRCTTEFGQQLLRLRKLMEREVAEMVESRKASKEFQWLGQALCQKMLATELEFRDPDTDN